MKHFCAPRKEPNEPAPRLCPWAPAQALPCFVDGRQWSSRGDKERGRLAGWCSPIRTRAATARPFTRWLVMLGLMQRHAHPAALPSNEPLSCALQQHSVAPIISTIASTGLLRIGSPSYQYASWRLRQRCCPKQIDLGDRYVDNIVGTRHLFRQHRWLTVTRRRNGNRDGLGIRP